MKFRLTDDPISDMQRFQAQYRPKGSRWDNRMYMRIRMRIKRLDRAFRIKQAEYQRARRADPEKHARDLDSHRRWKQSHPRKLRAINRRYWAKYRQRFCFFCGISSKHTRTLRTVSRMVIEHDQFIEKDVLWCGCAGNEKRTPRLRAKRAA